MTSCAIFDPASVMSLKILCIWHGNVCNNRAIILKMSSSTPYSFLAIFGAPSKRYPGFTPPDFFDNFGPTPFFQLSEALFWPKRRPKILNFYPTRNFGHLGRPLEDVRFYPTRYFGHFWAPTLVTLLIFRNVMTREHLNTLNTLNT